MKKTRPARTETPTGRPAKKQPGKAAATVVSKSGAKLPAARSGPRAAYHHGDLRNSLLEAAEALLEEGGIEALSLRDAARRAGVSHAAPYRHFPAKADLLYALSERGFRALDLEMKRAGESSADPVEQLEEAGFAYVRLAVRHPWRTQLMFGGLAPMTEGAPAALTKVARSSFEGLVNIIVGGQAREAFVEQEPLQLSLAVWGLVHGTAMLVAGGQFRGSSGKPTEEELRSIVRVVHRASVLGIVREKRRAKLDQDLTLPAWFPAIGPETGASAAAAKNDPAE
ncbi:MAG: TetR/AcrR family transcriptional regulator [Leptospirales bacterium]